MRGISYFCVFIDAIKDNTSKDSKQVAAKKESYVAYLLLNIV